MTGNVKIPQDSRPATCPRRSRIGEKQHIYKKEEVEFILKNHSSWTIPKMAERLNLTKCSVASKCHRLNLKKSVEKENNSQWKGDSVGLIALHEWIKNHKPKIELCECCNERKSYDLANISGKYKRDVNDFEWLCRKCHMNKDGRINNLVHKGGSKKGIQIKIVCAICKKEYFVTPYLKDKTKFCSLKCHNEFMRKKKI